MKLSERALDAGFWLGWNVLWVLPARLSHLLFDTVARISWLMRVKSVRQLELNLSRAMHVDAAQQDIRQIARNTMRSYMRYYCETFLLPRWSRDQIRSRVRAINTEVIHAALTDGGVILTLPHLGNWDLAGAWAADEFGSLATVAERLRPEGVFQKFLKMRRDRGISLMPLTGDGGTYEYLRDHVNQGHVVALLGDRDVARNGMGNQFFGHRASLPIGAALLAIDTGRPLFTCAPYYDGQDLVLEFDEEIIFDRTPVDGRNRLRRAQEVSALAIANFERHIRAHPDSWHQLQPVWSDLVASKG
jgi:phosphatidylinositol dimannoside acyltransferase